MGYEWKLAEKPTIEALQAHDYTFVEKNKHEELRDGRNHVLFRPHLIEAIQRINGVSEVDAEAVYHDLLTKTGNEEWLSLLRGNYARKVEGQTTNQTIRLIDFQNPDNNTFTVTNQLYVQSEKPRIPDVVVYINGIPVVVMEAKSPLNAKDKTGEAFDQIKQYERDIPRLFYSNCFSILTDGANVLYGATGSPSEFYGFWKDPWPKQADDFGNKLEAALYALLEPSRLLDLIAHFIVFEREDGKIVKKICRYHQFRGVNKIIKRVTDNKDRKGLIWHTQGSGKSLTMVFAALKLKTHLTETSDQLKNPNILVLTDRIDLDTQISGTFKGCGLPNPTHVDSVQDLHELIRGGSDGLMVLSTIFKFQGSRKPVANSEDWIVMVDECHRTQEKDLGAYLSATLPNARFFGFTGTPIKSNDHDTYERFGVADEGYLDRYGIDDAVADGATVPIHYTGRKTDWHVDGKKLDVLFDQWFADLPDDQLIELKKKGITIGEIVKHPQRVELIAYDIWTHFKGYAQPDGYKAQIVAYDREAVILYKRALTNVIADDYIKDGLSEAEAWEQADAMAACIYSENQEDDKPSEDPHIDGVRKDLVKYYLDKDAETTAKEAFKKKGSGPSFLIVCDKLLTGFDAPVEAVMYLDKPLKEHSLLQAIARTNRTYDANKKSGLIVDYIGVSAHLDEALSTYREADVKNAMRNLDDLRSQLKAAHASTMAMAKGVKRGTSDLKKEFDDFVKVLGTEDKWFDFRRKAKDFINTYAALSPDSAVLDYTWDLKWVGAFLQYGRQVFEKKEALDHKQYSMKIREMLEEHVVATGLSTTIKLRHITDPEFADDFALEGKPEDEIQRAAIRKSTELRKVTTEKVEDNPLRYQRFSDRVLAIIEKFEAGQMEALDVLTEYEKLAKELEQEASAHEQTGLSEYAYGILKILEAYVEGGAVATEDVAGEIHALYDSDQTAPNLWQDKEDLKRKLRSSVRSIVLKAGFENWKEIPQRIEEYALKHYAKV
jgi:type I restriction enzyme, R subunit